MSASWLKNAVFYEIYPQSFFDTNKDGIGDLRGIIEKLDYIKSLGCNALWINPCFDSPFKDAGYDVRDFKKIAARYGTNEDMEELFSVAHQKGIRVLLDLVAGHTSEEHEWFIKSGEQQRNEMSDRFIWTDEAFASADGLSFISGEHARNGSYITNFFKCQPALNFGFLNPRRPWQQPIDAEGPMKTREALKDIMRFWLSRGCDGFRIDMAPSLVKHDNEQKDGTKTVWRDILGTMHKEFPESAFVSEWGWATEALDCGFDMDFYMQLRRGYMSLTRDFSRDEFGRLITENNSFFHIESTADVSEFLDDYVPTYEKTKNKGLWCFITCNHDVERPAPMLSDRERRLFFAFMFTMPGAPFLYYGDEIGMNFRWLPTKEGGYRRTGARTPMQWSEGKNLGFSAAEAEKLYLPVDPSDNAPTVEAQEKDEQSFLNFTRSIIALRHRYEELQSFSPFSVFSAKKGSKMFAYKRGEMLIALNAGKDNETLELDGDYKIAFSYGNAYLDGKNATLPSQSFIVFNRI